MGFIGRGKVTHGGANTRLEVYLTQGESDSPLDCTILGKYVFTGIHATDAEVMVDVGLSYDVNGVVQVQAVQRDTGHRLALIVEPVPDDLSWLGRPPEVAVVGEPKRIRVFLLIDVSSSMIGQPLVEAQTAAREFLDRCDFTTMEVGLVSFSSLVALQCAATRDWHQISWSFGVTIGLPPFAQTTGVSHGVQAPSPSRLCLPLPRLPTRSAKRHHRGASGHQSTDRHSG